jgi:predicted permease
VSREFDDDRLPLSRARPVDEDVHRELAFHLEQRIAELVARGMARPEAERAALESFGDRARIAAECRAIERHRRSRMRRAERLGALGRDLAVGARVLRKNPGWSIMAVLTLALGTGATAAMFSIVNRVLLRPLPYTDPGRLVTIEERHEGGGTGDMPWANFLDLQAASRTVEAMTSYGSSVTTVLAGRTPLRVKAAAVSEGFFRVFPAQPHLGRLFLPEEHALGAAPVAVVSHAFWRDVLGAPLSLDTVRLRLALVHTVVGVLPPEFDFEDGTQIFGPMELAEQSTSRTSHNWSVTGRLRAGVTAAAAERELGLILAELRPRHAPDFDAAGAAVTGLQEARTGPLERPLYLLLGASALFLLAACTNLASGILARGTARQGEIAVRSALGATRLRLVRQLLTESALLAGLGCLAGLGLAAALLRALVPLAPAELRLHEVRIDGWVALFALGVALATTVLFGLVPALRLSASGTVFAIREAGVRSAGAARMRAWNVLVGVEVALALALLCGSVLLIRSFANVMATDLGFAPERLVIASLDLPGATYEPRSPRIAGFHERAVERIQALPGIERVGFTNVLPLAGGHPSGALLVEGKPEDPRGGFNAYAVYRVVGGDFFPAMGIPVLRGRALDASDHASAARVVVVNQVFAEQQWPGQDPLGKRIKVAGMDSGDEPWYTVVGVVGNVRSASVTDRLRPTYYFDHRQRPAYRSRAVSYAVRTRLEPGQVIPALRRAVAAVDPEVPVVIQPMRTNVARAVADRRFTLLVLGAFAALALVLAIVGIYGVVAYTVAQRAREIGVRRALGATTGQLRRLVLGSTLLAIGPGLVAGILLTAAAARALRALLYGVTPLDPLTLAGALLVIAAAGVLASLIPAARAARVDPLIAMRAE